MPLFVMSVAGLLPRRAVPCHRHGAHFPLHSRQEDRHVGTAGRRRHQGGGRARNGLSVTLCEALQLAWHPCLTQSTVVCSRQLVARDSILGTLRRTVEQEGPGALFQVSTRVMTAECGSLTMGMMRWSSRRLIRNSFYPFLVRGRASGQSSLEVCCRQHSCS